MSYALLIWEGVSTWTGNLILMPEPSTPSVQEW
jgi:hypothetical protein